MKTIVTFGSGQLTEFFVRPTNVMLVIEAENENEARQKLLIFLELVECFVHHILILMKQLKSFTIMV